MYYQLTSQQIRLLLPYRHTVRSITTDNGSEFCCHKMISKALAPKGTPNPNIVFFADSFSSWQKGAIKMPTNLSGNISPKAPIFLPYPVHSSAKFSIKSIEDLVKKWISTAQRMFSSGKSLILHLPVESREPGKDHDFQKNLSSFDLYGKNCYFCRH